MMVLMLKEGEKGPRVHFLASVAILSTCTLSHVTPGGYTIRCHLGGHLPDGEVSQQAEGGHGASRGARHLKYVVF